VTVSADEAVVSGGDDVSFTVVVQGPDNYTAACPTPLQLLVEDDSSLRVYAGTAPSGPSSPCGDVALTGAQRAVYTAVWPVDPSLPSGTYVAHLVLGDQPDYVVQLQLGLPTTLCHS